MNPRFVIVAVALAVVGGVIAVGSRLGGKALPAPSPTPGSLSSPQASRGPNCLELQKRVDPPSWFPRDLPLPDGSYATEILSSSEQKRATYAVKASLTDFVRYLLREWPKRGWTLGRGDAEPGEADDSFRSRDGTLVGAFKARSIYCDQNWTFVLFVIADVKPTASPS